MDIFKDTNTAKTNSELIDILKYNVKKAKELKDEIKRLKSTNIDHYVINKTEESKRIKNEYENIQITQEDIEYNYYYDPIKNIPINAKNEEVKEIIMDNLPNINNSNYYKLINRIKAEIFREIIEYSNMLSEYTNLDDSDKDFLNEIISNINFEKNKLSIINEIENQKDDKVEDINNNLIFLKTSSSNIYALDDIKCIDTEYYLSFKELIESIKNSTFKNVKNLTSINEKLSSISEVRGFKTRVIFDRVDKNTYIILQLIIKKSDFDKGYKKALENRISTYRYNEKNIIDNLSNDEFIKENKMIEDILIKKLSQYDKKVLKNG